MSKVSAELLADECDKLVQHHKSCVLFLGYLDPGWMLDPKHEARIRHAIRKFETHMISFHIESIPFAWKNEIDTVYYQSPKNGLSEIVDNGSTVHSESKDEDGSTS